MLVGKDLLVVAADDPKTEPTVSVLLPGPGEWYDYWTGAKHPAGELKVPERREHRRRNRQGGGDSRHCIHRLGQRIAFVLPF